MSQQDQIDELRSAVEALTQQLESSNYDLDTFWVLFGAVMVFFMQTGFAMLEVGSVQEKNIKNILMKNVFDACIGAIVFWLFGFGIAFGDSSHQAGGTNKYTTQGVDNYAFWLYQWAFSATSATIVSGAAAERIGFEAYFIYCIVICSLIYPFVAHWGWADGFMSAWRSNEKDKLFAGCGVIDFAGSGVVHMVGGAAALVAILFLGPRKNRFTPTGNRIVTVRNGSIFQCLGALILFTGWFGFNGVSTLKLTGLSEVAAKAMATTAIAASMGCVSAVVIGRVFEGYADFAYANNGLLAGLVAVTAGCATVDLEGAMVIGFVAAFIYYACSKLLAYLEIDDVVDAVPVHLANGAWGVFAAGLFTTRENYSKAYFSLYDNGDNRALHCVGGFYGGSGSQMLANFVFILVVLAWVIGTSTVLFASIKYTVGLRVSDDDEEVGLDASHHSAKPVSVQAIPQTEESRDVELTVNNGGDFK